MAKTLTEDEILDLPIADRLELIATLWNSLEPTSLPVPESHHRALDQALEEYTRNPETDQSWDTVRDDLFPKK